MADFVVSVALQRLTAVMENQIGEEINLVIGVKKEVLYLSSELNAIKSVLHDAERRGYKEKSIQYWLRKLEDISYDVDDVLDEWSFVILKLRIEGPENFVVPRFKVCSFIPSSCLPFKKLAIHHDIAVKISRLRKGLDMIVKEKDRYDFIIGQQTDPQKSYRVQSTSSLDSSEIHGREEDKHALVRKLMLVGQEVFGLDIISLVGTGGIGKTTLAQLVYNEDRVVNSFEIRIWVCVSHVFDEVRIVKGIVETVTGSSPNLNELEALLKCLKNSILGKRFLLVLDDVWTEDSTKWEPLKNSLKCGGPGSKLVVTTRSERVARMMGTTEIYNLGRLSDVNCWLLMRCVAFSGRSKENCDELQDIGKNIAKKCKGLPLAAKVLGSLLNFKNTMEEWENVLDNEIWRLEEVEVDLFPHLFLSYNELSPEMKQCFSYCAVFPKGSEVNIRNLIRMWMGLGYLSSNGSTGELELRGIEYFENLRMRSFFECWDGVSCRMHDILHDFARFLRKTRDLEDLIVGQARDPPLASQIKVYRSLFSPEELPAHLIKCLRILSLCKCDQSYEIPKYIDKLIHLRYLDLSRNILLEHVPQTICKLYNLQTLYLNNCALQGIPKGIGKLLHLRHLNLGCNSKIKELPETICNLHRLRTLNLAFCLSLSMLPEGIHKLKNLRDLPNDCTEKLNQIPQGLELLTELRTLRLIHVGRGWSKLGYLKKLDQLSGSLELKISLHDTEDVVEAQKAELRNKKHIQVLKFWFFDRMRRRDDDELIRNRVMEALQPPPNLRHLTILGYQGTMFPDWISSSINHLKTLEIQECDYHSTLPPLGKLPCLEELAVWSMARLKFLNREFLGIDGPSSGVVIGFPKLKKLSFRQCWSWKEWEDITAEEAGSASLSVMPCLRELNIDICGLTMLPYNLLLKASALEHLTIVDSLHLWRAYENNSSGWRVPPHIARVEVDYIETRAIRRSCETPIPVFYG